MQTSATYTARYNIPVHYKCSKCNSPVHGVIPVERTYMETSRGVLSENSMQALQNRVKRSAYERLIREIELQYRDGAIPQAHLINSKCAQCGYIEAWQNKPSQNLVINLIESILPFAYFIFALVNSFRIGFDFSLLAVVPLIILHWVAFFGILFVLGKIPKNKKPSKFKNIPRECIPQYSLSVDCAITNAMRLSNIPDLVEKATTRMHNSN